MHSIAQSAPMLSDMNILDLPHLCSIILSTVWRSSFPLSDITSQWNKERHSEFLSFANTIIYFTNLPESTIYLSLKYIQRYLSTASQPCLYGSEKLIFITALRLSMKFNDDYYPITEPDWQSLSGFTKLELSLFEHTVLSGLDYNLFVSLEEYNCWYNECNSCYNYHLSLIQSYIHHFIDINTPVHCIQNTPQWIESTDYYTPLSYSDDIDTLLLFDMSDDYNNICPNMYSHDITEEYGLDDLSYLFQSTQSLSLNNCI
ncbi:hypothetical protein BDB01DRAFT_494763 [Pilobolus umbonatus]|nr:hypothetical protein BDB01DRAFT_494763 [Pilobolus umbonatus]